MTTSFQKSMKVYGVPFSVHTRKVILTACLKSIPHEIVPVVPVIPDSPPPNWRAISPTGQIPAIDADGYVLADSTAIVLYLERRVQDPALLPGALDDYGRALSLDAWAGAALFRDVVRPIFHHQIVNPNIHKQPGDRVAIDVAVQQSGPEAFAYLERLVPGTYLVGGKLSIADLAVVSNLLVFCYLGHRVDPARFPQLTMYFQRHLDSSLVRAVVERERPFVEGMALDRTFLA
jgi:glutathione S-transferase